MPSRKMYFFFLCIYKIYVISAEEYKMGFTFIRVQKTGEIWVSMKDVGSDLGVKNMSDLVLKEIKKYKMTEREIFEKDANLTENQLSENSNKKVYVKTMLLQLLLNGAGVREKRRKKNRWIQKKVDDSRF